MITEIAVIALITIWVLLFRLGMFRPTLPRKNAEQEASRMNPTDKRNH